MSKRKRPTIDPNKIHLFSINVFQGSLETAPELLEKPVLDVDAPANFNMGVEREIAHNLEAGLTRIRLFFKLVALEKDTQEEIGLEAEYGIEFHFHMDNFSDFVQYDKEENPMIDQHLAATMIGIAYSTSRGIILERLQGTLFRSVLLPVVSPYKILEQSPRVEE